MTPARARHLFGALLLPLAAGALFACAEDRPESATVALLMTASNNGEIGPCG